jgi:hypothetical protein
LLFWGAKEALIPLIKKLLLDNLPGRSHQPGLLPGGSWRTSSPQSKIAPKAALFNILTPPRSKNFPVPLSGAQKNAPNLFSKLGVYMLTLAEGAINN